MKKLKWASLALATTLGVSMLAACAPQPDDSDNTVTVPTEYTVNYYDTDGTTKLKTDMVKEGEKAARWIPSKEGYNFVEWYTTMSYTTAWSFENKITQNTNIYGLFEALPPTPVEPEVTQYPVELASDGLTFTYGWEGSQMTVEIGEKSIYLDGRLSDEEIANKANVYNSFNDALAAATDGTEAEPMTIYMAPYVYWIHDPASESTTEAFGIIKKTENLHLVGLTNDRRNVVIAGNYGHNEGYMGGNWTMFNFSGDGLTIRDMTIGDYCNVDLEYPLNPKLSYPKRTDNITQGQIATYGGDKLYCNNVNFISRLNMMPFNNSKRALYVDCHMESTDDSLNGSSKAVYLNCDLDFYASKPWGGSSGVTLLNCDLNSKQINVDANPVQYLSKGGGGYYNLIDCRYSHEYNKELALGWSDVINSTYRSYYSNVTLNGEPTTIDNGGKRPDASVDISNTEILKAFKLIDTNGEVVYNVYNLLRGTDDWDPLGQKEVITALKATDISTRMTASLKSGSATLEEGTAETAVLKWNITGPQATDYNADAVVTWSIKDSDKNHVSMTTNEDGTCTIASINTEDEAAKVIVTAKSNLGHEAAFEITAKASTLPAPTISGTPVITQNSDGTAKIDYTLQDMSGRADNSRLTWYVCDNATGDNAIAIAIGRTSTPLKSIPLTDAYIGKYIKVKIETKHIRSNYGEAVEIISPTAITATGINSSNKLSTDFSTFSTAAQTQVIPGFWTVDAHKPLDVLSDQYTDIDATEPDTRWYETAKKWTSPITPNSWSYGTGGKNGFLDYSGIYQIGRGARLMYTPLGDTFGDMDATIKVAPGKTASQGFGSDYQYMDVMIKYDTTTLSGYGLRIYRTSGDSCAFVLMEFQNGIHKNLCEPVTSSAYLTECTIRVWTEGGKLNASVSTTKEQPATAIAKGYKHNFTLQAAITGNAHGGFALLHTGTTGDNSTYIGSCEIEWKK